MNRITRNLAAGLAAVVLAGPALAADATSASKPAPYKPTAKQLAALCADCAIVSAEKTEKRKGKASGVGAVGGAVAGGVVGRQVGDSTGATVGGAVVGGLIGHEVEKRVKSHTVWVTTVTLKDGTTKKFEADKDPGVKLGDVVHVEGEHLRKNAGK